jgi:hypothetical protein
MEIRLTGSRRSYWNAGSDGSHPNIESLLQAGSNTVALKT